MTGRSLPEWIGKTPDAKVPPRVRQRVFDAYNRTCYLSSIIIASGMAWEIEHRKPLHLGGEHRESNLAPALTEHHKLKTAAEMRAKAKADRIAKRNSGSQAVPKQKIQSPGFPPSTRMRSPKAVMARRPMFVDRGPA